MLNHGFEAEYAVHGSHSTFTEYRGRKTHRNHKEAWAVLVLQPGSSVATSRTVDVKDVFDLRASFNTLILQSQLMICKTAYG